MHKLFAFSFLTVYGVTLVIVSGKRCIGTDSAETRCEYGCCGGNNSYTPCCDSAAGKNYSLFTAFYALAISIVVLFVLCFIGRCVCLSQRRQHPIQRSGTFYSQRHLSQIQMTANREGRNGAANTEGNGIYNVTFHSDDVAKDPPPYDEAMKSDSILVPIAQEQNDL